MTAMLFAYGTLIPVDEERLRREGWVPDAVKGRLYDLGRHPALVDLDDQRAGWVLGYVRPVDMDELQGPLDAYEEVEKGLFRRVQTTTRAGLGVWVYVFSRALTARCTRTAGALASAVGRSSVTACAWCGRS